MSSETSELDIPNLPFKKPKKLEQLEKLGFDQREGMDGVAMHEEVDEAADSLATAYKKQSDDYEGCVAVVTTALMEMGGAFGGNFGATMVGYSGRAARRACRE